MMLSGKTLYVDMVDIKPPGIFLILAGFQLVFGYSVFVIRLLVSLWIGATAFLIYKTGKLLINDQKASFASGLIYLFLISTWSFYGLSITPEIFFNLFTISALYLLLKKQSPLNLFLAGLLAGMGFIVKYLVIFDFAAFLVFLLLMDYRRKDKPVFPRLIVSSAIAGLGFILPFALTNLYYYLNGHFDALYNIVYLAPGRYPSAFDPWKMLKFVLDLHIRFLPVFIFFYYVLIDKKFSVQEITGLKRLGLLWSLMALIAVMLAGKTFGHYTIQLMLPLSLVAGAFFHSERRLPVSWRRPFSGKKGWIIMIVLILSISLMKLEYVFRKDIPREIVAYLKPKLKTEDVIYTGNYHHILYYLLEKNSPTRYVHRSLLLKEVHIKALDINVDEEFGKIMAQRPVYIITEKDYPDGMMKDFIFKNYNVEKEFGDRVLVYRLVEK